MRPPIPTVHPRSGAPAVAPTEVQQKPKSLTERMMEAQKTKDIMNKDGMDVRENNVEAFTSAFSRGITAGGDDFALAAVGRGEGEDYAERRADIKKRESALANQNKVANFAGEIAGGIALDVAATKGGATMLNMGRRAKGLMGTAAQALTNGTAYLGNNAWGRMAAQGSLGAAHGTANALFEEESVGWGSTLGGVGGVGGQALFGELLPAATRVATGWKGFGKNQENVKRIAEGELWRILKKNNPGLDDSDPALISKVTDAMSDLGPNATIGQADEALRRVGLSVLADPRYVDISSPFAAKMQQQMETMPRTFEASMERTLKNGTVAPADVEDYAVELFNKNSDRLSGVLQNDPKKYKVSAAVDSLRDAFTVKNKRTGEVLASSPDTQKLQKALEGDLFKMVNSKQTKPLIATRGDRKGKVAKSFDELSDEQLDAINFNAQELEIFRQAVDKRYKDAGDKLNPKKNVDQGANRLLVNYRKNLSGFMKNNIDGYKEVMRSYADTHTIKDAYDNGAKFAASTTDPSAYAIYMDSLSAPELEMFLEGTKYTLARRFAKQNKGNRTAKQIDADEFAAEKIVTAFGPLGEDLVTQARHLANSEKGLLDATGARAGAAAGALAPTGAGNLIDAGIAIAGGLSQNVSQAAGLGAGRRLLSGKGFDKRFLGELMEGLAKSGDEAGQFLEGVAERNANPDLPNLTASDIFGMLGIQLADPLSDEKDE